MGRVDQYCRNAFNFAAVTVPSSDASPLSADAAGVGGGGGCVGTGAGARVGGGRGGGSLCCACSVGVRCSTIRGAMTTSSGPIVGAPVGAIGAANVGTAEG